MEPKKDEVVQQTALDKVKTIARQRFETAVTLAKDLKKQAESIVITDDNTLAMANQILSKMNLTLKNTKTTGLAMRKPYNEACGAIMELEKEVTNPLDEGLIIGKEKLNVWNKAQEAIKKAADDLLLKQQTLLNNLTEQMQAKADACVTPEQCQKLIDNIKTLWPATERFGPYADNAQIEQTRYLTLLGVKKTALDNALKGGSGSTQAIAQMKEVEKETLAETIVAKTVIAEKTTALQTTNAFAVTKGNTRKTLKFEVIDATLIPREWLMIDEAKVREYMNSMKSQLEAGPFTSYGIKFYIDNTVVIR